MRRAGSVLLLVGLALGLGAGLWLSRSRSPAEPTAPSQAAAPSPAPEPREPLPPLPLATPVEGVLDAESGSGLRLRTGDLPADRPLELRVRFPGVMPDGSLPVELFDLDSHEILELAASLPEDRRSIRVEIPAGALQPGAYVVEMRTPERSHFPARRVRLEIE